MRNAILASLICTSVLFNGCASLNDAMTPSIESLQDKFDGSAILRQRPVNAAGSLGESFHLLGFDWSSCTPDSVFITAGAVGTRAIRDVQFNIDGKFIRDAKPASTMTEFANGNSYRRFEIPIEVFIAIASAKSVKMRLDGINDYTVSSFGPEGTGSMAIVNSKFQPFVAKLREMRPVRP